MKKTPKISVVLAVFNGERYLKDSIESILRQEFKEFELIIVNDNSTDRSVEIAEGFCKKDRRVSVLHNTEVPNNLPYSRNIGVKASLGEYIAIQDADDISLPGRLHLQAKYLDENPKCAVVGGDLVLIDEENKGTIERRRSYPRKDSEIRKAMWFMNSIAICASMIKKEAYLRVGSADIPFSLGEDLFFWFKFGKPHSFVLEI